MINSDMSGQSLHYFEGDSSSVTEAMPTNTAWVQLNPFRILLHVFKSQWYDGHNKQVKPTGDGCSCCAYCLFPIPHGRLNREKEQSFKMFNRCGRNACSYNSTVKASSSRKSHLKIALSGLHWYLFIDEAEAVCLKFGPSAGFNVVF